VELLQALEGRSGNWAALRSFNEARPLTVDHRQTQPSRRIPKGEASSSCGSEWAHNQNGGCGRTRRNGQAGVRCANL